MSLGVSAHKTSECYYSPVYDCVCVCCVSDHCKCSNLHFADLLMVISLLAISLKSQMTSSLTCLTRS